METAMEEIDHLHSISLRLLSAYVSLGKLIDDQPLGEKEKINLHRTGDLLSKVYWDSCYHYDNYSTESEAEEVRLEFYATLLTLNKNKEEAAPQFLDKELLDQFCLILKYGGDCQLPPKSIIAAAERFMDRWSEEVLQKKNYYYLCHPKPKVT